MFFVWIQDVVDRLKCFQKYPRKVKHELSRVIFYESFSDGRVIIQQGHLGISFYFILSGKVLVYLNEKDKAGKTNCSIPSRTHADTQARTHTCTHFI